MFVSDLGLYCLPNTLLGVCILQWVKFSLLKDIHQSAVHSFIRYGTFFLLLIDDSHEMSRLIFYENKKMYIYLKVPSAGVVICTFRVKALW